MDERLKAAVDELRKLAKGDELRKIEAIAKRFDDAISANVNAGDIIEEAFDLEKKYIPMIPHNRSISDRMKCDSMVMTVGFQKAPIILSILCMKPEKVILLHTDGSRRTTLEVEDDPQIKEMGVEIITRLITEYDASKNYGIIRDEVLPYASGNVVIDPTAGRKVMVASLALVAFYMRFPMVYVHSVEYKGAVFPFTERLRIIENPFEFFGDTELGLVEEQFNCHLYEAAYNTCLQLEKKVLDLATRSKVAMFRELISVYLDWDSFLHSSVPEEKRLKPLLSERLEAIVDDFRKRRLGECLPDNVDANIMFLRELDRTWRKTENIIDEFRLVDIFASALRRKKQKKYDDAVGRFYRCLEMCSTIKLAESGLTDTRDPDYDALASGIGKTSEWLRCEYRELKHRDLPQRLGLDDQMTLLGIISEGEGKVIAHIYERMKESRDNKKSLIEIRNRSILAHGTNPVPEERWPDFKRETENIIRKTIEAKRFRKLLDMAMHGEIRIKSCPD